jgi:hypothetical protein
MSFDTQLLLMLVAVVGALMQRRLNILIFSANHIVVLLAFRNLELRGQPPAFSYLPEMLFAPPLLRDASEVLSVPTTMFVGAGVVRLNVRTRAEPLVKIPTGVLWALATYFVFLLFSTRTLFQTVYASADQTLYGATAGGGIYVLAWAVTTFELRRRVDAGQMPAGRALGLVFGMIVFLDFLKGTTGIAAGIVTTVGFLVFIPGILAEGRASVTPQSTGHSTFRAFVAAALLLISLAGMVMFVRNSRTYIATEGIDGAAVIAFGRLTSLSSSESNEGLEGAANGTQGAAHVLMCVALYDNHHSREWRSIWGPLEYTVKPAVLLGPLGLTRSREAAWELGDYFIHGGGINTFGEFYWNGGYFCLILMSAVTIGFLLAVDVLARRNWAWFALACCIAPGLVQGYGYGFAQVFRGIANGVIFLVPFVAYLRWVEERNRRPALSVVGFARRPTPIEPRRAS